MELKYGRKAFHQQRILLLIMEELGDWDWKGFYNAIMAESSFSFYC